MTWRDETYELTGNLKSLPQGGAMIFLPPSLDLRRVAEEMSIKIESFTSGFSSIKSVGARRLIRFCANLAGIATALGTLFQDFRPGALERRRSLWAGVAPVRSRPSF
jgi:hypothetical protein